MSDPATLTRARRGSALGGQATVEDHLGAHAGEAARAVRRAGLRPALDRQVGHPAEAVGRVVAQEPAGGQMLARGAMVTLYVAAPSPAEAPSSEDRHGNALVPGGDVARAAESPSASAQTAARAAGARRRRASFSYHAADPTGVPANFVLRSASHGASHSERGRGRCGPVDEHPLPRRELAEYPSIPAAESAAATWSAAAEGSEEPAPSGASAGPSSDVLESMRNAFARTNRRRLYPREPLSLRALAALSWARRRAVRLVICVLLLVWVTFAISHRGTGSPEPRAGVRRAPGSRASKPTASRIAAPGSPAVRAPRHPRRPRHLRPLVRSAPAHSVRQPPPEPHPQQPPPERVPAPSRTAVPQPTPTPTPARSTGGPFSP
jgi:hypothetical protein